MDVLPLIATASGAVIALSGTLLADIRRDRQQRDRDGGHVRREVYVGFALALNAAHDGLRQLGDAAEAEAEAANGTGNEAANERPAAANRVLTEAGLYGARERLLMIATAPVAAAGEAVFLRLGGIRDVIRAGARTESQEYHDAYHQWAEAVWRFRMAVRSELGQPALTSIGFEETGWSEREECAFCNQQQR